MLVAIDPGVNSPGIAVFKGDTLFAACHIEINKLDLCLGARWKDVSRQIGSWVMAMCSGEIIHAVVYEKPQVYTWGKSKGDPNDLLGLAAIGAGVAMMFNSADTFTYEPDEWIGQVPKVCPRCDGKKTEKLSGKRVKKICPACDSTAWGTPRGRFIQGRLSIDERAVAEDQGDCIDAIGIGLKKLGRLQPTRVYSNGRE